MVFVCRLVLSTISKMDAARKCYQLVGGVLVEKTIETVIPDVTFNRDRVRLCVVRCASLLSPLYAPLPQISAFVEQLTKTLQTKTAEINELQRKFGSSVGKVSDKGDGGDATESSRSSKGVLVA